MRFLPYKPFSLLTLAIIFFSSCASYQYSNKRKQENFKLTVLEDPNGIVSETDLSPQIAPSEASSSRGLMTDAVSLAAEGVKLFIEMDKKKQTAGYASSKQQLYFYNYLSEKSAIDATGIQFEGIELLRMTEIKKGVSDTAFFIRLVLDTDAPQELYNNSIFRLKVDEFYMNYSKAKIPGYRWYMPWSAFNINKKSINVDLEVVFTSSWMNKNGNMQRDNTVGSFSLNLRNIPLDPASENFDTYRNDITGKALNGQAFLIPRTFGRFVTHEGELKECYGQGAYNITVNVNEAGKPHFITKIAQDNSNAVIDEINMNLMNFLDK